MKLNMKIAVLFALLFASMSWGSDYVNELFLSYGNSDDAKWVINQNTSKFVTNKVSYENGTDVSNAQDLLANTNCGKSCYAYMGYTTTPYLKNLNGTTHVLPITNIIVKEYNAGESAVNQFYEYPGAGHYVRYERLYQYKKTNNGLERIDNYDICNGNCNSSRRIYIYYTRDYFDGEVVYDVKASTETIYGYEQIGVDLTGGKGKKPIYLYVSRRTPNFGGTFDPYPSVRTGGIFSIHNLTYTGSSRVLMANLGTPIGDHVDHVEYSVFDGYYYNGNYLQLNGSWSTKIPAATEVGTYRVFAKIVSSHRFYADYLYGMYNGNKLEVTINKAPKLEGYAYEPDANMNFTSKKYYLYSAKFYNQYSASYDVVSGSAKNEFYSGDKIALNWSDKCHARSALFYYSKDGGERIEYNISGDNLMSGTYDFFVSFDETPYCEAMDFEKFATIEVKKSKVTFNANGGSFNGASTISMEGEYGENYDYPGAPTRTGYKFEKWNPTPASLVSFPRGDNTYVAQWTIKQYTITLNAGNGVFSDGKSVKTITQDYGTSVTKPEDPTRTDYVFNRWRLMIPQGVNTNKIPTTMPAVDMTFVALWKYNRFKVNLPEQMEVVSGDVADDGTYLNGSTVKFRVKAEYLVRNDLTYNGKSVVPDKNGIYSITVVGKDADVVAEIVKDYGAIQIAADGSKAYIDGDKVSVATDVPEETEVSSVEMNRTFTPFIATTIALPFTVDLEYVWGGVFCKFLGMAKSGFQYTARLMFVSTSIKANEPYVFVPFDEHISIDLPKGETVKIKTEEKSTVFGDWSFNSLYHEKVWKDGVSEDDVKGDVGYGFSASTASSDGVSGSFVKMTNGSIGAMQGYILYRVNKPQSINRSPSMAGKSAPSFSVEDLPDEIGIEIVTENGKTVALGKVNTVTGKVKLDCWFDMKGNLLKGKPTTKGVYIYNGKQVTIK